MGRVLFGLTPPEGWGGGATLAWLSRPSSCRFLVYGRYCSQVESASKHLEQVAAAREDVQMKLEVGAGPCGGESEGKGQLPHSLPGWRSLCHLSGSAKGQGYECVCDCVSVCVCCV